MPTMTTRTRPSRLHLGQDAGDLAPVEEDVVRPLDRAPRHHSRDAHRDGDAGHEAICGTRAARRARPQHDRAVEVRAGGETQPRPSRPRPARLRLGDDDRALRRARRASSRATVLVESTLVEAVDVAPSQPSQVRAIAAAVSGVRRSRASRASMRYRSGAEARCASHRSDREHLWRRARLRSPRDCSRLRHPRSKPSRSSRHELTVMLQVDRRRRVRQRADRDEVDAGRRDRRARSRGVTPPEASTTARARRRARTACGDARRRDMLSSRITSAPAASASSTSRERAALDLDLRPCAARAARAARDRGARRRRRRRCGCP